MIRLVVNIRSHWSLLWPMLMLIVGFLAIPFLIKIQYGDESITALALNISLWILIVSIIPAVALHIYYLGLNANTIIEQKGSEITVIRSGEKLAFDLSEIDRINIKLSVSASFGGVPFIPSENYFIGSIVLADKSTIKVTSLLDINLHWLRSLIPEKTSYSTRPLCF